MDTHATAKLSILDCLSQEIQRLADHRRFKVERVDSAASDLAPTLPKEPDAVGSDVQNSKVQAPDAKP